MTEPATAMPNSLKRRPVLPLRNASGGSHFVVAYRYDDPSEGQSPDDPSLYWINDPYQGKQRRLSAYREYSRLHVFSRVAGGVGF